MQASMSEVVLPLDGRDDEGVHHSTEMDQIGSSCRDESQLSFQIDDGTLEDVANVIDETLVQYFGITSPSVTQNEHQPSPPPRVTRADVPVEQELSKTAEPKRFSIDSAEPNLVSIDRYGSAMDSNWDETETDYNYYTPHYAQEVVVPYQEVASDKGPSERLVTTSNPDYSLDVIVPEKLGVQGFPFDEALNPLASTPNPNPMQEESPFFDDMDLNPASLKDCKSFYEAQTNELSAEGSPENVSPGCSNMHIVPMSDGMLEVASQSPPEELVGSVGLDVVGKNVIVEMNPAASPDVARVPCSSSVCQPLSPPPSYRQAMSAAYQKAGFDSLSCGPYGTGVVKNKIVLSFSGEGVSETDSRDSIDYGPPKLVPIDDSHASTNDQPNDYPPMLEPADPAFVSSGKVAAHVIPSAAGEALEATKKLSPLGDVPENDQELLESSSQEELNECLGKLVPSITPDISKEIPSGYIVNDMYNVRNIIPESSNIACADDVGSLPDLLPVTEEPKLYRTFNRSNTKKKKHEPAEPYNKVLSKISAGNPNTSQQGNQTTVNSTKLSTAPSEKIPPKTRLVKVSMPIPQQTLTTLMHHSDVMCKTNFKIIPTTSTTINVGEKKIMIVKPQNMKDKIVLLKPANIKKIFPSDLESVTSLKPVSILQSSDHEKLHFVQTIDGKFASVSSETLPYSNLMLKELKDESNPPPVKGMAASERVSLPVSLPLHLLSVKPKPTVEVAKKVEPKPTVEVAKKVEPSKNDEPIEKAVRADGDVDQNVVMETMKVSVPFLFPVTKPDVKPCKIEQPVTPTVKKKAVAPPPVVVKMTSKAARKSFSPIREVVPSPEQLKSHSPTKPNETLAKKTDSTKPLKGDPQTSQRASELSLNANAPINNETAKGRVEAVVEPLISKERVVQSISNEPKKRTHEPSLMKPTESSRDDLTSFLSSFSVPEERPKGVENLEKVVHETIIAASALVAKDEPATLAKTESTHDPIIIPPSMRTDDPLSLKVGLEPCKFRNQEPNKKRIFSQVAAPLSSHCVLPSTKQFGPKRVPTTNNKKNIELPSSHSTPDIVPPPETASVNPEVSQVETEEKVLPILVELVNQLIESNSKSPQIFSEQEKPHSEDGQLSKNEHESTTAKQQKSQNSQETVIAGNRAKEDGILAGVVKERTSKLIQKARDLVLDVNVPSVDVRNSSAASPPVKVSNEQLKARSPEITSKQVMSRKDSSVSDGKPFEISKDDKTKCTESVQEVVPRISEKVPSDSASIIKKRPETIPGKKNSNLQAKETEISSNPNATVVSTDQKIKEIESPLPLALSDKNPPGEKPLMQEQLEITKTQPAKQNLAVPKEKVPIESKRKLLDSKCSAKTYGMLEVRSITIADSINRAKITSEDAVTSQLPIDGPAVTSKNSEESEMRKGKNDSVLKATDLPKTTPTSADKPPQHKKIKASEDANLPKMTTGITGTKSKDSKQNTKKNNASSSKTIEPHKKDQTSTSNEVIKQPEVPESLQQLQTRIVPTAIGGKTEGSKTENDVKSTKKTVVLPKNATVEPLEATKELIPDAVQQECGSAISTSKASDDLKHKNVKKRDSVPDSDPPNKSLPTAVVKPSKQQVIVNDKSAKKEAPSPNISVATLKASEQQKDSSGKSNLKIPDSSRKAANDSVKLTEQSELPVSAKAIDRQSPLSDIPVPTNGATEDVKTGGKKTVTSSHPTEKLSQKVPSYADLKPKLPEVEAVPSTDPPTSVSVSMLVNKVNKQQTAPASDQRTSTRRKSRSDVPVSTSDVKKVGMREGNGSLERVHSPEKTCKVEKEKVNGPLSLKTADMPSSKDVASNPSTVIQESKDILLPEKEGAPGLLSAGVNDITTQKSAKLQKIPDKTGHRMRTRASAPTAGDTLNDGVEAPKENGGVVQSDVPPADITPNDALLKQSPVNEKTSNRPRTRSETSNEKKLVDEASDNNGTAVSLTEDEPEISNSKSLGKKIVVRSMSPPVTPSVVSSPTEQATAQKEDGNVRTRGKIERKPATVKPIPPATPKKGAKPLGSSKIQDSLLAEEIGVLNDIHTEPSAEDTVVSNSVSVAEPGDDVAVTTPISKRRASIPRTHVKPNSGPNVSTVPSVKAQSIIRKSTSNRAGLRRDPKRNLPKKNLRIPMKPKKVSKGKNNAKTLVSDPYDFTDDDDDQCIKMQTIDHYRKVSGKSMSKSTKNSFSRFGSSQSSLLSDDENICNNHSRTARKETSKVIPGKTKRRSSPRKSISEPRKSESKKDVESHLKNVTSESTESLLSCSSETFLPAERRENLRNSRNESIRLAKQNRLKKSPIRKLTSAEIEEAKSPKPSTARETRRSSGSRAIPPDNLVTDKKDEKLVQGLSTSGTQLAVAEESKSMPGISTRETRRSSGSITVSEDCQVAGTDKKDSGKKDSVLPADKTRKKSPAKKDHGNREKISDESSKVPKPNSVGSSALIGVKPDVGNISHVSTRSKSRDSVHEDDSVLPPRVSRSKGAVQTSQVANEGKHPKLGEAKNASKSEEAVNKIKHKTANVVENDPVLVSSNPDFHPQVDAMRPKLSTKEVDTANDEASNNRMTTRSAGASLLKTAENDLMENTGSQASLLCDDGAFLPKLRSSASKKIDVFVKPEHEPRDVQCPSTVQTNVKVSKMLPSKVDGVNRSILVPDKLKKIKTDSMSFPNNKNCELGVDCSRESATNPVTVATTDATGKHKRAKKGGVADSVSDLMLSQSPHLTTQDIASRNAEAVSLITPPMDTTVSQEPDNIQPVGAISQHGEPEGAKSSTRTAQLRSLVVPLEEDGRNATNSIGFLRKKSKKLVDKKTLTLPPVIADNKSIDDEVITRKVNDVSIRSGNKHSSVDCLVPPVRYERLRNHVDNTVVPKQFSPSESSYVSKSGVSIQSPSKSPDEGVSNQEEKPNRRITRSSLPSLSSDSDVKNQLSLECEEELAVEPNISSSSITSPVFSQLDSTPGSSKDENPPVHMAEAISPRRIHHPVKESRLPKPDVKGGDTELISRAPVETVSRKPTKEVPENEFDVSNAFRPSRGRKPKDVLKYALPGKNEMKFVQPKPLISEKPKDTSDIISPGFPSEELPAAGKITIVGRPKTSNSKDVLSKSNGYSLLPRVSRVKITTKDVCEISGEAEKLFEEASLDGRERFDVIVPSPGKSPDSTTLNSEVIPALSPEIENLPIAKISEDAHGVTSTTELGSNSDIESKMHVSPHDTEISRFPTKKEDEGVSSTTVDSTKIIETIEIGSSSDDVIPLKRLPSKPLTIIGERVSNVKSMTKDIKFLGEALKSPDGDLKHPKKIWRVSPVVTVMTATTETTAKIAVGSSDNEVSHTVKPPISSEELKRTPLKKRQVWAYSVERQSTPDDVKNMASKSSVEGEPSVIHSTNDSCTLPNNSKVLPQNVDTGNVVVEEGSIDKSNATASSDKADGTCSPTSGDLITHSIRKILAATAGNIAANGEDPTAMVATKEDALQITAKEKDHMDAVIIEEITTHSLTLIEGAKRLEPDTVETNETDERSGIDESRLKPYDERKMNKNVKCGMSSKSTKSRTLERHVVALKRRAKTIKKRCKDVRKIGTFRQKLIPSDNLPGSDKNRVGVTQADSNVTQGNGVTNEDKKALPFDGKNGGGKTNCGASSSPAAQPLSAEKTSLHVSLPKANVVEPAKPCVEESVPPMNDKFAELVVDTADKEIDDEESPPFSPIASDSSKNSDWSQPSGTNAESVTAKKNSPVSMPSSVTQVFQGMPPDVRRADTAYRRSHERMRSYSNDDSDRSDPQSPKTRMRRKSHPADTILADYIPVDLSNHVKPIGMKIPTSMPKLDLTGIAPIYHRETEQPLIPYDLSPTKLVRPLPTPPPSYSPHRPLVVLKGNGPIRPIPTVRVTSPGVPYMVNQFPPNDREKSIQLSSRMNAASAFHATKQKPTSPVFTGSKKTDYSNPLLFAHENKYILNAGLSNVVPSSASSSTYQCLPSPTVKPNKIDPARSKMDSAVYNVTPSASKSVVQSAGSILLDSTEFPGKDIKLLEARDQLSITNPELSISRSNISRDGEPLTKKSVDTSEVMHLESNVELPCIRLAVSSGSSSHVSHKINPEENESAECAEDIEPLDVVTCELDEGTTNSSTLPPQKNVPDIGLEPSPSTRKQDCLKAEAMIAKKIPEPTPTAHVSPGGAEKTELAKEDCLVENGETKKSRTTQRTATTPRRRISILDSHKSKKNTVPAVVTSFPSESRAVHNTNEILLKDSESTKQSETDVTVACPEKISGSPKASSVSVDGKGLKPSSLENDTGSEVRIKPVDNGKSAHSLNTAVAKSFDCQKGNKEPLAAEGASVNSNSVAESRAKTSPKKDEGRKAPTPERVPPTESKGEHEKIKMLSKIDSILNKPKVPALKPNETVQIAISNVTESSGTYAQEHKKVEVMTVDQKTDEEPLKMITVATAIKPKDSVTKTIADSRPPAEPSIDTPTKQSDGKPNEAKTEVATKSTAEPKIQSSITKANVEPTSEVIMKTNVEVKTKDKPTRVIPQSVSSTAITQHISGQHDGNCMAPEAIPESRANEDSVTDICTTNGKLEKKGIEVETAGASESLPLQAGGVVEINYGTIGVAANEPVNELKITIDDQSVDLGTSNSGSVRTPQLAETLETTEKLPSKTVAMESKMKPVGSATSILTDKDKDGKVASKLPEDLEHNPKTSAETTSPPIPAPSSISKPTTEPPAQPGQGDINESTPVLLNGTTSSPPSSISKLTAEPSAQPVQGNINESTPLNGTTSSPPSSISKLTTEPPAQPAQGDFNESAPVLLNGTTSSPPPSISKPTTDPTAQPAQGDINESTPVLLNVTTSSPPSSISKLTTEPPTQPAQGDINESTPVLLNGTTSSPPPSMSKLTTEPPAQPAQGDINESTPVLLNGTTSSPPPSISKPTTEPPAQPSQGDINESTPVLSNGTSSSPPSSISKLTTEPPAQPAQGDLNESAPVLLNGTTSSPPALTNCLQESSNKSIGARVPTSEALTTKPCIADDEVPLVEAECGSNTVVGDVNKPCTPEVNITLESKDSPATKQEENETRQDKKEDDKKNISNEIEDTKNISDGTEDKKYEERVTSSPATVPAPLEQEEIELKEQPTKPEDEVCGMTTSTQQKDEVLRTLIVARNQEKDSRQASDSAETDNITHNVDVDKPYDDNVVESVKRTEVEVTTDATNELVGNSLPSSEKPKIKNSSLSVALPDMPSPTQKTNDSDPSVKSSEEIPLEGQIIPSHLEGPESEDASKVSGNVDCLGEVTSTVAENNDISPLASEPSNAHQLPAAPELSAESSSMRNEEPCLVLDKSSSSTHERTHEAETVDVTPSSSGTSHVEVIPKRCELPSDNVGHSKRIPNTLPKDSAASNESSLKSDHDDCSSNYHLKLNCMEPSKPSHPTQQTNADKSAPELTHNNKEGESAKIPESSSERLPVDGSKTVPTSTSKTCAIVNSPLSSLLLPSTENCNKNENIQDGVNPMSATRPERKRKRPARWSLEEGIVGSKVLRSMAGSSGEKSFEVACPDDSGKTLKIDPSVPKVEVEFLCQSVAQKLQESLGISIDQIDMANLKRYWVEVHSNYSRDVIVGRAEDGRSNQPQETPDKPHTETEALPASDIQAMPGTSRNTVRSRAVESSSKEGANPVPKRMDEILSERNRYAKASCLEIPVRRGEKRTVSEAFRSNIYIYKRPAPRRPALADLIARRQALPRLSDSPPVGLIKQPPQVTYSWLVEQLREHRRRSRYRESNVPIEHYDDFIRPREEYVRPTLKEVYRTYMEGHAGPMVGYSRVSTVQEVPVSAGTSSSTPSRIPTVTISSDSEDSNPGNSEEAVNERDEVRRRIRRKSNSPSIAPCSCPHPGHASSRTSCRRDRYHAHGVFSPVRSPAPPLISEISHVDHQETARVRGNAATVGGGDEPITVADRESAVHIIKSLIANRTSRRDLENEDPPISAPRDSLSSYQELMFPQSTLSRGEPPQSSSSAHPPSDTERVPGATFQRCLQQKPFSEQDRLEDNNDHVQHDSPISTGRQNFSSTSQPRTSAGLLGNPISATLSDLKQAERLSSESSVGADPSTGHHGHSSLPSSSTTDDRGPQRKKPSKAAQNIVANLLNVLNNVPPDLYGEIIELSSHNADPPDGPPTKKKKS